MGFEADKIADGIRQKIKQFLSNDDSQNQTAEIGLTDSESEDLNQGLSGEHISAGFSEAEAKELTKKLSGHEKPVNDMSKFKEEKGKNRESVPTYSEEKECFLNLTPDSLKYFTKNYPNAAKAYLNSGVITILDNQNVAILDKNGEPVTINYNTVKDSPSLDLVSFYINHAKNELDIVRLFELKELQDKASATSPTDPNYHALLYEIELQKLDIMSEKERKNYITTKMLNAFSNKDAGAWFNTMSEFFDYKCRVIDQKFGISGTKELIKEKTHLNDLITYINNILNDKTDKLTKTELIWEIIKGIGDAIDSFIITQELKMKEAFGEATKAAYSIPKVGPVLSGAIQAFFGAESAFLLEAKTADADNTDIDTEPNLYERKAKSGGKAFIEEFKGLQVKAFRAKISEAGTIDDLNGIRKIIDESSFTKAEKQMLRNECAKQQGKIGRKPNKPNSAENLNSENIRSVLANEIKQYETPEQKEMANLWLSDKRLYLAVDDMETKIHWLDHILKDCTTENINIRKTLINKLFENPSFLDKNGALIQDAILIIKDIQKEHLDIVMKMLDEYKNSDSKLNARAFLNILNSINFAKDDIVKLTTLLRTIMNSKKINPEPIEKENDFEYLSSLSENGKTISGVPLEDILANPNLKEIARFHAYGIHGKEISELQKTLIKNTAFKQSVKPILIKNANGGSISYAQTVNNILQMLCSVMQEYDNLSLMEFVSKFLTDKTTGTNPKALSMLYNLLSETDVKNPHKNLYNFEIFSYVFEHPEFSQDNIIQIVQHTTPKSLSLSKKIIDNNGLTAQEKTEIISAVDGNNQELITLVELILDKSCLNTDSLQKLIQTTRILDAHNRNGNNKNIDPEKVNIYLRLLQNPKTVDWTIKMIDEGWDIETISRIAATKQDFSLNDNSEASITDRNTNFFMELGLNQKEANSIVKAISQSGTINTEMQQTAVDLINAGIPKNKIGQILSSATIMGDFNPRVPTDAMALHGMGLNGFAERYLPIINNLSAEDISVKFDSKTKNQLKTMVENISGRTKPALRAKGFDIEGILKKLEFATGNQNNDNNA